MENNHRHDGNGTQQLDVDADCVMGRVHGSFSVTLDGSDDYDDASFSVVAQTIQLGCPSERTKSQFSSKIPSTRCCTFTRQSRGATGIVSPPLVRCSKREKLMKNYGCLNIAFDFFMIIITGGLWLIWILVKYLRTH